MVITVHKKNAIIGGMTWNRGSFSSVKNIMMQNVDQMMKFTNTEYLNEVSKRDLPFEIFLKTNFPPNHSDIIKAMPNPIIENL